MAGRTVLKGENHRFHGLDAVVYVFGTHREKPDSFCENSKIG
jgi:hypothetical protein